MSLDIQDVYDYSDYRKYLNDRYWYVKKTKPHVSFQHFAEKTSLSKSYLKLVISGKRHITLDKLETVTNYLNISSAEKIFFIFLFLMNTSKEAQVRDYFGMVVSLLKNRKNRRNVVPDVAKIAHQEMYDSVWGSWLPMTVHAMATLPDFEANAEWIRAKLADSSSLSLEEIKKVLDLFVEKKVIVEENGRWRAAVDTLSDDLIGFLQPMGKYADAFERMKRAAANSKGHLPFKAQLSSATLTDEEFQEISEDMSKVMQKIVALSTSNKPNKRVFLYTSAFCSVANPKPQQTNE